MKYSEQFKQEVLYWIKTNNTTIYAAHKHFNINQTTLKYWIDPNFRKLHNFKINKRQKERLQQDQKYYKDYKLKVNKRARERFKTDPEYRKLIQLRALKQLKERYKNNPEYRKLHNLRTNNRIRELQHKGIVKETYSLKDKQYTLDLFNHQCAVCGSTERLEIDHWMPWCMGFKLSKTNAVVLCKICNSKKGKRLPHDHYQKEVYQLIEQKLGISTPS